MVLAWKRRLGILVSASVLMTALVVAVVRDAVPLAGQTSGCTPSGASQIITAWYFNPASLEPSVGQGSIEPLNGVAFVDYYGSLQTMGYADWGQDNGKSGIAINVSTVGFGNIELSFTQGFEPTSANTRRVLAGSPAGTFQEVHYGHFTSALFPLTKTLDTEASNRPDLKISIVAEFAPPQYRHYRAAGNDGTPEGIQYRPDGIWNFRDIVIRGRPCRETSSAPSSSAPSSSAVSSSAPPSSGPTSSEPPSSSVPSSSAVPSSAAPSSVPSSSALSSSLHSSSVLSSSAPASLVPSSSIPSSSAPPSSAASTAAASLRARYTFDDATARDVTDHGNNGAPAAGVTFTGLCMYCDGVDDRVDLPNFDMQEFSFTGWVQKQEGTVGIPPSVLAARGVGGWAVGFLAQDSGQMYLSKTQTEEVTGQSLVSHETFRHIAVTYDGAVARFYLDGQPDGTASYPQTFDSGGMPYQLCSRTNIGGLAYTAAYKGWLDDLRVYAGVLTPQEIAAIAQEPYSCEPPVPAVSFAASSAPSSVPRSSSAPSSAPSSVPRTSSALSSVPQSSLKPAAPEPSSASAAFSSIAAAAAPSVPDAVCGNGRTEAGEMCDDGNTINADACTNSCKRAFCGDGVVAVGEQCDEGLYNADIADACRLSCTLPACGDGIVDTDEICDDGNRNADDECTNACRVGVNARCTSDADCSSDLCVGGVCVMKDVCGNGVVENDEWCDDGDADNDDGCDDICFLTFDTACTSNEACASGLCDGVCIAVPACGDGQIQKGEECDQGVANSNVVPNRCRLNCQVASIGDGVIDNGEECDDGNIIGNDGCDAEGRSERVAVGSLIEPSVNLDQRSPVTQPFSQVFPAALLSAPLPAAFVGMANVQHAGAPLSNPETGPAALVFMLSGASAGFAWTRLRRRR